MLYGETELTCRGLGLGTQNFSQNEPWTILKPAWLQRINFSSAKHSCVAGLTLILVIYHDLICLMSEERFVVSAL